MCSYPMADYDLDAPFLFGDCVFTNHTGGDLTLTMEVTEAAEMAAYPARSVLLLTPIVTCIRNSSSY